MKEAFVCGVALLSATMAFAGPVQRGSAGAGTIYLGPIADQDWARPIGEGDLDGDGYNEVIVSASESFGDVISKVYVMRGGPDARFRGTIDLMTNGVDQVILGETINDNLGSSITTGDVNGDGVDDLLVCASLAHYGGRQYAGYAYLIYGGSDFFDSPTRDLGTNGTWDLRIAGPVAAGDMGGAGSFGGQDTHAAAIGNLNGDNLGDIVLGVHLAEGDTGVEDAGRVYAVMGKAFTPGDTLDLALGADYDVRIYGEGRFDETGDVVLTGDLTGDGIDEIIIPNHYFSQANFDSEGAVHIYRGRASWPSSFTLRTTRADITLLGYRFYDELGESAAVGDFNGDGIKDLAAGAPGAEAVFNSQRGDGFVYGLLGKASYQTGSHLIDYATASADFLIIGDFQENLGMRTAAGDFNGDGIDDVAAAEWFGGPATNGVVEVLFGRNFTGGPTFYTGVDTDVRITGSVASDRIGFSMGATDVDSNGVDEILFGTPFNNGSFPNEAGTVYVMSLLDGNYNGGPGADLADFAAFQACYTLPGAPASNGGCYVFDIVNDGVLNQADVNAFVDRVVGP